MHSKPADTWTTTTLADQSAVDHERAFGPVPATGETIQVRVAQRVEYNLLVTPIEIHVHPLRLHFGDTEFSLPQGREAQAAFTAALNFAESMESRSSPSD